jgi:hypothetical protein
MTYGGVDLLVNVFFTSALLHAPAALPLERAPGTDWIEGWVHLTAPLHDTEKWKSFCLLGLEL